jgi:Leucine-rich repeat (LRR) protein
MLLDLPDVKLINCKPLYFLENITQMNLENNMIEDFEDQVSPMLMTLQHLNTLNLKGNPVVRLTPKYRDQVVVLTRA